MIDRRRVSVAKDLGSFEVSEANSSDEEDIGVPEFGKYKNVPNI